MAIVTFIVMEPGAKWPGQTGAAENVVIVGDGEGLLRRVTNRLLGIHQHGHQVKLAVLACSDAVDRESDERRSALADALLRAVALTSFGRLVLTSGDGVSAEVRRDLLCLADALSCKLDGTRVSVSVRFGSEGSTPARQAPLCLSSPRPLERQARAFTVRAAAR